jgi:hypothetical protein
MSTWNLPAGEVQLMIKADKVNAVCKLPRKCERPQSVTTLRYTDSLPASIILISSYFMHSGICISDITAATTSDINVFSHRNHSSTMALSGCTLNLHQGNAICGITAASFDSRHRASQRLLHMLLIILQINVKQTFYIAELICVETASKTSQCKKLCCQNCLQQVSYDKQFH